MVGFLEIPLNPLKILKIPFKSLSLLVVYLPLLLDSHTFVPPLLPLLMLDGKKTIMAIMAEK